MSAPEQRQARDSAAMTFADAALDAAQTVLLQQQAGALAVDVARDLGCAPTWATIEMEIRARNLIAHLARPRSKPLRPAA